MIEAPHIGDSHDAASLRDEIKSLEQEIRDKQRILDLLYSGKHDLAEKLIEEGTTTAVIVLSQFYSKPDPSMLTGKDALLYYNLQEAGYIMTLQNMRASWNRGDDHSEDMSDISLYSYDTKFHSEGSGGEPEFSADKLLFASNSAGETVSITTVHMIA